MDLKNIAILTLFTILLVEIGTHAIKLDINPKTCEETSTVPIHVDCLKSDSEDDDRHVKSVVLSKDDEVLVEFFGPCKNAIFVNDTRQIQAIGSTENKDSKSYVKMTLSNPKRGDTGTYTCNVHYTDQKHTLHVDTASGHLVVEKVDIKSKFGTQKARTDILEAKQIQFRTEDLDVQRKVKELSTYVSKLEREITELKKKDESFTAFSATIIRNKTTKDSQGLNFPHVITNHGSGYDTGTGSFQAPRHGIYVFTVVVGALTNEDDACSSFDLDLVTTRANEKRVIAKLNARDNSNKIDQSSTSAVVELNKGDNVYCVMRDDGCTVRNDHYSLFSGYIIKAL